MKKSEQRTRCRFCGGGLTLHEDTGKEGSTWAHNDRPLSETAGHTAIPSTAAIESVEV